MPSELKDKINLAIENKTVELTLKLFKTPTALDSYVVRQALMEGSIIVLKILREEGL